VSTSGGGATVIDIVPCIQTDPVPLVLVPGWGQTFEAYTGAMRVFVERGRRVLSLYRPGRGYRVRGETILPAEEVRKMQALIGAFAQLAIERADIVAHSEGGLCALLAAAYYPHRVRSLVLVDSGGLIVGDRWHRLAGRFALMLAQCTLEAAADPEVRRALVLAAVNPLHHTLLHPLRSIAQLNALASWNAVDLLPVIREAGVGLALFTGVDNRIFPLERSGPFVHNGTRLVHGFHTVRGGHARLLGDARYASAVLYTLDRLRALSAARAAHDPTPESLRPGATR
jgi:pimeloyl-ACP methyl ester carboxylesterase